MLSLLKRFIKKEPIVEYYPTNPETIIVKNQFYPKGLTELDLYNYYMKNKGAILHQVKDRDVMFFLGLETSEPVVKRKTPEGKFIRLNSSNYKDLITGRTLSIHSTMRKNEEFGIIDIDSNHFRKSRTATLDVYNHIKNVEQVQGIQIRYTGKDGFHIVCFFTKKMHIDKIRGFLKETLASKFSNKYEVAFHKKITNKVNLDLSSNKYRGAYITLGSLSILGLKCMSIPNTKLNSFRKEEAKII